MKRLPLGILLFATPAILSACDADEGFGGIDLDRAAAPAGKADGATSVSVSPAGGGYDEVIVRGRAALELFIAMRDAGFSRASHSGLDYAYGSYSLCVSNGAAAACQLYSREVTTGVGGFLATTHGARLNSASSEIFAALSYSQGFSPASTFEVSGNQLVCGKTTSQVWCGIRDDAPATRTLTLDFDDLETVGPDFVYEGWLITSEGPVSSGRFDLDEGTTLSFEIDEAVVADSSMFVLTLEPAVGDDPAPADTHVLAGAFAGNAAELTVDHPAALATDFTDAMGQFFLQTPSTANIADDYNQGIWFLIPGEGEPSLDLPELPAGWAYEGWVVTDDGPISTGRFTDPAGEDSDRGGPAAGPDGTPPFPGSDFIDPALDLVGKKYVLSVEPEPDYSAAPFAIKPLIGDIEDAGPGVLQPTMNMALDTLPSGAATLE